MRSNTGDLLRAGSISKTRPSERIGRGLCDGCPGGLIYTRRIKSSPRQCISAFFFGMRPFAWVLEFRKASRIDSEREGGVRLVSRSRLNLVVWRNRPGSRILPIPASRRNASKPIHPSILIPIREPRPHGKGPLPERGRCYSRGGSQLPSTPALASIFPASRKGRLTPLHLGFRVISFFDSPLTSDREKVC